MHYSNLQLFASLLIVSMAVASSDGLVGVNYGRIGDDLPSPQSVPRLLRSIGVGRVRLYDADPSVVRAFCNSGVDVVVSLPDDCLAAVAADPTEALAWARDHVYAFFPAAKISAVVVGDEVLTGENALALAPRLVPAMENLHAALATLGLERHIAVTSAHSLSVLAKPSYPPSHGAFRSELLPYLRGLLDFHARTGSPFFIDALPYAAYTENPSGIDLDFALLDPAATSLTDPTTGLCYTNLLHAQVDAVHHAIAAANGGRVEVMVSETGWPSAGDAGETAATLRNAVRYNSNLMRLLAKREGTPLVSEEPLRAYVFALFNENRKPGPSSERNYGLFKPDCTPAYQLEVSPPVDKGGDYTTSIGCSGICGGSSCSDGVGGGNPCGVGIGGDSSCDGVGGGSSSGSVGGGNPCGVGNGGCSSCGDFGGGSCSGSVGGGKPCVVGNGGGSSCGGFGGGSYCGSVGGGNPCGFGNGGGSSCDGVTGGQSTTGDPGYGQSGATRDPGYGQSGATSFSSTSRRRAATAAIGAVVTVLEYTF